MKKTICLIAALLILSSLLAACGGDGTRDNAGANAGRSAGANAGINAGRNAGADAGVHTWK